MSVLTKFRALCHGLIEWSYRVGELRIEWVKIIDPRRKAIWKQVELKKEEQNKIDLKKTTEKQFLITGIGFIRDLQVPLTSSIYQSIYFQSA